MKKYSFSKAEKIVIKLGSSIVTNAGDGLNEECLSNLIKQISKLSLKNKKVVLVSSGAVAAGLKKLGIKTVYYSVDDNYVNDFIYEQIVKFNKFN